LGRNATPWSAVDLTAAEGSPPSSIRELQNVIERAVALGTGPVVDLADLPLVAQARPGTTVRFIPWT